MIAPPPQHAAAVRQVAGLWQTLVVGVPVQLDETTAGAVRTSLLAAAERRPHVLVADMSGTKWCDWAGAGALAGVFSRALAGGTELRVVAADAAVRRVLCLNGLDRMMPVCQDVTAALALPPAASLTPPPPPAQAAVARATSACSQHALTGRSIEACSCC